MSTADGFHIRLRNVTKRYGGRTILDAIDLDIPTGQTVCLIGPSGGGKSTLLRCVNGLADFDTGEVRVGPHVLTPEVVRKGGDVVQQVRLQFGMIFQDFQLFPHLTALGNVVEAPMHVRGTSRAETSEQAMKLLQRVGMGDHAEKYPRQLSGGQKQRVAMARAMAMDPKGLLCDEITSALDPELVAEVLTLVKELAQEGMTMLLATHEMGFARDVSSKVAILADGRIEEAGPPEQIFSNPTSERARTFLRSIIEAQRL
jgi:polar amino acid transport system ATP-binding protein